MKHISVILTLILCIYNVNAQNSIPQETSIDSIFSDWNKPETPGGALGIIKDGKLIYAKGYGAANLEYNIPNSPQSVFRIASTSKQFTAACIVLLSQQGKLSLGDKLIKFFPDFPAYANNITIQHLLNHTSGIRDYLSLASLSGLEDEDHYTDKTVMKWLANQEELNFKPGDEYLYSNSGYWLLGQIVNKVSGVSMAKYAKENIFDPLGMDNTHFHNDHTQIVKNRASGYSPSKQKGYSISMTTLDMIGDGGVFTTVEDLKKWDDNFYDSKILNQDFWNKMTTVGTLNNGEQITYASGLGIDTYKGLKTIQHGGAFVGYRAEMIRLPEQRFTVILLANRSDANPTRMAFQVADIFLKDEFKENDNAATDSNFTKENIKSISLSKDQLSAFEGTYWNNDDKISRKLEVRNDTLHYVRSNGRTTKMIPIAKDTFQWFISNPTIILKFDDSGSPKNFSLDIPGETLSNFRAYMPMDSFTDNDLKTYSGDYYNRDLDVVYTFKTEGKGMALYINGELADPIIPIMKNALTLAPFMIFEFNETNDACILSVGRVKNLKFVKK
ncbi:serine hydrolase domain-containing protein [Aquimarina rubra]|uniref:Serine hydrolase domain-containing protein n=1 Tax=Aquimarina rubra TaxID=1920033 RepID=A0ABW5LCP5_9FLAO